jgi:hypothetical protein
MARAVTGKVGKGVAAGLRIAALPDNLGADQQ